MGLYGNMLILNKWYMRIYISIPISNLDEKKQREKADRVKTMLSKMGHKAINPFEIYAGKEATLGRQIGYDIAVLIDFADAIFLCKGWRKSKGCQVEAKVAEVYGKQIIYEERDED